MTLKKWILFLNYPQDPKYQIFLKKIEFTNDGINLADIGSKIKVIESIMAYKICFSKSSLIFQNTVVLV
jgi:hypothetical protein